MTIYFGNNSHITPCFKINSLFHRSPEIAELVFKLGSMTE